VALAHSAGFNSLIWVILAADLLVPAAVIFPKEWLIRYDLACYACQLGKREEASASFLRIRHNCRFDPLLWRFNQIIPTLPQTVRLCQRKSGRADAGRA
jgi:hypothetical protein